MKKLRISSARTSVLMRRIIWVCSMPFLGSGLACQSSRERSEGWSEATHGDEVSANYELLFDVESIQEIEVHLSAETSVEMQDDLRIALAGDVTPAWFSATVVHDGRDWEHVGIRYRGNGTIEDLQDEGSERFPFRLTFDKWEDDFPDTKNQRFYGFKRLNFLASAKDESLVREVLASEIFAAAEVPAARASFIRVHLDEGDGEGRSYLGIYTLMEDLEDAETQENQLGGKGGNLYEPTADGGALLTNSVDQLERKNNEEDAAIDDVAQFLGALHSSREDESTWTSALEATFDVEGFLKTMALSRGMGNHRTYGCSSENYFLYASPERGERFVMVPWDLDRTFSDDYGHCGDLESSNDEFLYVEEGRWPLLENVLSVDAYWEKYVELLRQAHDEWLESGAVAERAARLHDAIEPFLVGDQAVLSAEDTDAFLHSIEGEGALAEIIELRESALGDSLAGLSGP